MKNSLRCPTVVFSILVFCCALSACRQVPSGKAPAARRSPVGVKTEPLRFNTLFNTQPDTNRQLVKVEYALDMENLAIRYRAHMREGDRRVVNEKSGDYELDCKFGRYATCGGWGRWQMLNVAMQGDQGRMDGVRTYVMDDCCLLETDARLMAELVWPVDSQNTGRLVMKIVKERKYPQWYFMNLALENTTSLWSNVEFGYFSGPDASPSDRQAWATTQSGSYQYETWQEINILKKRRPFTTFATNDFGLVLYLKQDPVYDGYGGLLVYLPEEVARAGIDWRPVITPKPGVRNLRVAVGYFTQESPAKIIRQFIDKDAEAIRRYLAALDWKPAFDFKPVEALIRELDDFKKDPALDALFARHQYDRLRKDYDQFKASGDFRGIVRIRRSLARLEEVAMTEKMKLMLNQ